MDHAPARGGDSRRPHWWVGIGGRRALLLLRACWWYGQRKRLVQVQAKVVAGPGGGNDMLLLHTYIPTYHYFSHHRPRCCPACAVGIVYVPSSRRAAAESWLTRRRAKANTLPTSRLLPARERRERLSCGTHALLLEVQSRLQVALLLPGAAAAAAGPASYAATPG